MPHVEEDVKWGHDLCFLIGRKMFCVLNLEPARGDRSMVAIKATPEEFAELVEREGVIPAPYMARNHWVSLQDYSALPWRELQQGIARSYELVKATLPKKVQAELSTGAGKPRAAKRPVRPAARTRSKARLSKRR
ncbi:MAG: MmcQ/YjbR family DNA-binding protein [Candidatus Koribacter versatilis]|uniref:MmcQ/YjbR family DNA-binding protein n=1 Tax=Candidatus Korobacter versatilis TaxID=658062 RepID=A0A932A6C7_9BACT|nr:MmcQ/YjbR family DNA-binding protein [Candidatus Koribacter versatilis]